MNMNGGKMNDLWADLIKDHEELSHYVVIEQCHDHYVDFEVHESHYTTQLDEELFMIGYIKWDGCSNWRFEHSYPFHFCQPKEVDTFALLIKKLYEFAAKLMPDYADNMKDY